MSLIERLRAWFRNWRLGRREGVFVRASDVHHATRAGQHLPGWSIVTAREYPHLHEAFETISHDSGAGCGYETYSVPPEWAPWILTAERELSTLSLEELQTFCIGEESEQLAIKSRSAGMATTHNMLSAFFEDWETD